uniref:Protein bric-a-brac 2 n=1 Tax=Cacopsylla melanoneura TaxID=428564 RepID=A0A8D8ZA63_9HEMI
MTSAAAMGSKSFHLRWNNHLTNLRSLLESLYNDQNLVDVTLSCKDGTVRAHKLMLSACSPYFETIFRSHEVEHPVVILKGVSKKEMKCLVDYMYVGSLEVSEDELPSLLSVANELQIKGLIQKPATTTTTTTTNKPSSSPSHHSSSNEHLSTSTDNEDEDVDMMEEKQQHRPLPLPLKVNMPPPSVRMSPPPPMRILSPPVAPKTPSEQTFNNVTQYGGGVVKPPDTLQTESATSIGAAGEDKNYSEDEQMLIAPDGEILEPVNGHNNNNNGHIKSSSQSQYIGHCLDEALSQPDLQCRICKR